MGTDGKAPAGGLARDETLPLDTKHPEALSQPLLQAEAFDGDDDNSVTSEGLRAEAVRVFSLAGPVAVSELLSFLSYLITTAQVGQLGAAALSSFTLARTFFHITGLSILSGLSSGQDTFSGQAFGAKHFAGVGVTMQRAVVINLALIVGLFTFWWTGVEHVMLLLGQDPGIVPGAASLLRAMSPSLLPWALSLPLHSYFSSQGVVLPLACLSAAGTALTPVANHVFIARYGLNGVAVAYNVLLTVEVTAMAGLVAWLHRRQPAGEKTWAGIDLPAALALRPTLAFLRIAIPGLAMVVLDWWCFELMVLLAGLQPDAGVQLGAMGVLFATHSLAYVACSGFGTAAATRTSNELGAGRPERARRATIVAAAAGVLVNFTFAAGFVLFRQPWARIYSDDPKVIEVIDGAMGYLALAVLADSLNAVLSGVLRGCGHQKVGFVINLITFWMIGLPLAYALDLRAGLGATGVWMALSGVGLLQAVVLIVTTSLFDWCKLAARAQQLVAEGHGLSETDLAAAAAGPGGHHGVFEPLLGAPHV